MDVNEGEFDNFDSIFYLNHERDSLSRKNDNKEEPKNLHPSFDLVNVDTSVDFYRYESSQLLKQNEIDHSIDTFPFQKPRGYLIKQSQGLACGDTRYGGLRRRCVA